MDIKILVAAHKPYWMPTDDVYLPLHVGAEGKNVDLGFVKDNSGDNISAKNPYFCELTGLYWAWKNLQCDYVGLCHYRRYFGHAIFTGNAEQKKKAIFGRRDYEKILQSHDGILPLKDTDLIKSTIYDHYQRHHRIADLEEVGRIIYEVYPDYCEAYKSVLQQHEVFLYNMFVLRRDYFSAYCEWLFSILFALEKRIDVSSYDNYQKRVFGFLGERLFNVWLQKKGLKMAEVSVVSLEEKVSIFRNIKHYIRGKRQEL